MNGLKMAILSALAASFLPGAAVAENSPASIAAPGLTKVLVLHAVGAQVYQCKAGPDGKHSWTFREPIAALLRDGETVGQHFAGPSWRLADGSVVRGKVVGKAAGATTADAPWLKLEATAHEGQGALRDVAVIQRVDTHGGALSGACDPQGAFRAVPYTADYVFLKK